MTTNSKPEYRLAITLPIRLCFTLCSIALICANAFAAGQTTQTGEGASKIVKDFAGRPIPKLAHELIDLAKPADIPAKKTAALPGWIYKDGTDRAGNEFENRPVATLLDNDLHIEMLYKKGYRVGVIRKFFPDRSWQIMDLFQHSKHERLTISCDLKGHTIPDGHLLVGVMREGDPRTEPVPPRPTEMEQIRYRKDNFRKSMPRSCIGDLQQARLSATLNLTTGKLTKYSGKPVTCISPYFDPCASDGVTE
jgi:hypothetical protein